MHELLATFGMTRAGAIISPGAADADPVQLSRALLKVAVGRGARLFQEEAAEFDSAGRSVAVRLKNGRHIDARSVILATGYALPDIVHSTIQNVSSSWAIATAPQPDRIWKDGALIWEDSKDYLYARTTTSGRIIIGGEDSDDVIEPEARDRLIAGEIPYPDAEARCALAAGQPRYRVSLGRHVRHDQRWLAADRSGSRNQGHLCGLRLWRQRHHLQLSCRRN